MTETVSHKKEWKKRILLFVTGIVCQFSICVTSVVMFVVFIQSHDRRNEDFAESRIAIVQDETMASLRNMVHRSNHIAHVIQRHFEIEESKTPPTSFDEFRILTQDLTDKFVQAMEWVPLVAHADRAEMERQASEEMNMTIKFMDQVNGVAVPLGNRSYYWPVRFVRPLEGNEVAILHSGTSVARNTPINQTRDSGELVVSASVTLLQGDGSQKGILLFAPVYKGEWPTTLEQRQAQITGVVLILFRGGDMIVNSLELSDICFQVTICDFTGDRSDLIFSGIKTGPGSTWDDWEDVSQDGDLTRCSAASALSLDVSSTRTYTVAVDPTSCFDDTVFVSTNFTVAYVLFAFISVFSILYMVFSLVTGLRFVNQHEQSMEKVMKREHQLSVAKKEAENACQQRGEFVAFICHELRNPLNSVTLAMQLLMDEDLVEGTSGTSGTSISGTAESLSLRRPKRTISLDAPPNQCRRSERGGSEERNVSRRSSEGLPTGTAMKKEEDVQATYGAVWRSCELMRTILNDVLDLTKMSMHELVFEVENVDLHAMVNDLLTLFEPHAHTRELDWQVSVKQGVPRWIRCDPTRLHQVMVNLVSNALKFTARGTVLLTVELHPEHMRDASTHEERNIEWLLFSVRDTGMGISEEDMKKLFLTFSQANRSLTRQFGGCGLGLSIVKSIVERMGGEVHVQSQVRQGSVFSFSVPVEAVSKAVPTPKGKRGFRFGRVTLPLPCAIEMSDLPELVEEGTKEEEEEKRLAQHVLVVEDSRVNRLFLTRLLERQGFDTSAASDGAEAVELVRNNPAVFDFIIMDIIMPNLNGVEATRLIRQGGFTKPIVALTANAMEHEHQQYRDAGMDDVLTKPVNIQHLREVLNRD